MSLRYSADTSAILGAWARRLPPDIVPSFWSRVTGMIGRQELQCIDEVKKELEKKDDDVLAWVKSQNGLVCPLSQAVFTESQSIVRSYSALTKPGSGRNGADPFVIALAKVTGAAVLTEERPATKPGDMKIPDVCRELGITCLSIYDFARKEGWKF